MAVLTESAKFQQRVRWKRRAGLRFQNDLPFCITVSHAIDPRIKALGQSKITTPGREKAEKIAGGLVSKSLESFSYLMNEWEWPQGFPKSELQ
jgi:hypothetical protein